MHPVELVDWPFNSQWEMIQTQLILWWPKKKHLSGVKLRCQAPRRHFGPLGIVLFSNAENRCWCSVLTGRGVHATAQRERSEDTYCTEQEHGWDRPPCHYSRAWSGNQRLMTFAATKTPSLPLILRTTKDIHFTRSNCLIKEATWIRP